jgi:hypothetical protein
MDINGNLQVNVVLLLLLGSTAVNRIITVVLFKRGKIFFLFLFLISFSFIAFAPFLVRVVFLLFGCDGCSTCVYELDLGIAVISS